MPFATVLARYSLANTVHHSCDVGHTIDKGVLDALTQWTVSCDTGGVLVLSIEIHGAVCRAETWNLSAARLDVAQGLGAVN